MVSDSASGCRRRDTWLKPGQWLVQGWANQNKWDSTLGLWAYWKKESFFPKQKLETCRPGGGWEVGCVCELPLRGNPAQDQWRSSQETARSWVLIESFKPPNPDMSRSIIWPLTHTYTKEDRKGNSNISMKSLLLLNNVQFIHHSWLPPDWSK